VIALPATDLAPLLPEGILAVGLCVVLLCDLSKGTRARGTALWVAVVVAVAAAVAAFTGTGTGPISDMLLLDTTARLVRPAIAALTALVLLAACGETRNDSELGALAASVLGIGLGAMLLSSAANLVPMWLGLELASLSSYVLAAWRGGDRKAAEAGMKYVLFGGATSGLMLFGISHLYGLTGHLDFQGIGQALAGGMPLPVTAALLLAGAGLAYKLTIVPLHLYAPDVYQGAPSLSLAALVMPKVAAGALLIRALGMVVPVSLVSPHALAAGLAVAASLSLLVSSLTAVAQRDAKRIVAFSSVGLGGTVLLALACLPGPDASASVVFYLLAYAAAAIGALVCLSVIERERGSCDLKVLAGSGAERPWLAAALCLFLFSLAGVPPLAGFLGKWAVLQQSLAKGLGPGGNTALAWTALVLLATTAISAWAYLMIVRAVVLAPANAGTGNAAPPARLPWPTAAVLLLCAAATVGLGIWFDGLRAIAGALSP